MRSKIHNSSHSAKDILETSEIQLGKYQHYKGNFYEVIGLVLHTETNEKLVIYRALYDLAKQNNGNQKLEFFARPYNMFFEKVVFNGQELDRFKFVGDKELKENGEIRVA